MSARFRTGIAAALLLLPAAGCLDVLNSPENDRAMLDWINRNATPIASFDPAAATADLEAFGGMVGAARVVGMGEATQGTRESQMMKHRVFRFLAETRGFRTFAIDASLPESMEIDRFVRTGEGDLDVLLSQLHFWGQNTSELRAAIRWMRDWNIGQPEESKIRFVGVNIQYPALAIDSAVAWVDRNAPDRSDAIRAAYGCVEPFRNDETGTFRRDLAYEAARSTIGTDCRQGVNDALAIVQAVMPAPTSASASADHQLAVRYATVVQQWTLVELGYKTRDDAMAENTQWWLTRLGPASRAFLWTHNTHVWRRFGAMGAGLAAYNGDRYVSVGFAFDSGGFNAIDRRNGRVTSFAANRAPEASHEHLFSAANAGSYYFDTRAADGGAATWMTLGRKMRIIGAVFDPTVPEFGFGPVNLGGSYDILIFTRRTTPSSLLQFVY